MTRDESRSHPRKVAAAILACTVLSLTSLLICFTPVALEGRVAKPGVETMMLSSPGDLEIISPTGTTWGHANVNLTYQNNTLFDETWIKINDGPRVNVSGNMTIDLTNSSFGVLADGAHVLELFGKYSNGSEIMVSSNFTVWSFRIHSLQNQNAVHDILAPVTRYNATNLDYYMYNLDGVFRNVPGGLNATNFTFDVGYVSITDNHALQLAGFAGNQSWNYTFYSNMVYFTNVGFANATNTGLQLVIRPNMPPKLEPGASAVFDIEFKNTGSVDLHRVTLHLSNGNRFLVGDITAGASVEKRLSIALAQEYTTFYVGFNITADEYAEAGLYAYYDPNDPLRLLMESWPWLALLAAIVGAVTLVALFYRARLKGIKKREREAEKEKADKQVKAELDMRRRMDRFAKEKTPKLALQEDGGVAEPEEVPLTPKKGKVAPPPVSPVAPAIPLPTRPTTPPLAEELPGDQSEAPDGTDLPPEKEDISVDLQRDKCIVHGGVIQGASYICTCGTKYCLKCAMSLSDQDDSCWQCKAPFDL